MNSELQSNNRAAVISAVRTPFVKSFGVFEDESALSLSIRVAQEAIQRSNVPAADIEECIWSVVIPQTKNPNIGRDLILYSGLPRHISGYTLNKACASSIQTSAIAADSIKAGRNKVFLVGGVEVLSDVPITYSDEARKFLTKLSRAKTFKEKISLISGINPKWFLPKPPALAEPFTGFTMGEHAEMMCVKNNISRKSQDEFAIQSHSRASHAEKEGYFKDEIIPVWAGKQKNIFVDADNMIRSDANMESMAKLKPAFDRKNGTITAGNSSPLTDGASAAIIVSEDYAQKHSLDVLGYIVDYVSYSTDPHFQLLIGPAMTIPLLLKRNNLSVDDVGVFEIHEAFAGQVLSCLSALEDKGFCKDYINLPPLGPIPNDKLNIDGGAVAIGHPFAATGIRLISRALRIAQRKQCKYAVISACTAGAMSMAMLLETPQK